MREHAKQEGGVCRFAGTMLDAALAGFDVWRRLRKVSNVELTRLGAAFCAGRRASRLDKFHLAFAERRVAMLPIDCSGLQHYQRVRKMIIILIFQGLTAQWLFDELRKDGGSVFFTFRTVAWEYALSRSEKSSPLFQFRKRCNWLAGCLQRLQRLAGCFQNGCHWLAVRVCAAAVKRC
jgi:hypothetical protein